MNNDNGKGYTSGDDIIDVRPHDNDGKITEGADVRPESSAHERPEGRPETRSGGSQYPPRPPHDERYYRDDRYGGDYDRYRRRRRRGGSLVLLIIAVIFVVNVVSYSGLVTFTRVGVATQSFSIAIPDVSVIVEEARVATIASAQNLPLIKDKAFPVKDVKDITVELASTALYIYQAEGNEVRVLWYSEYDQSKQITTVEVSGGELVIEEDFKLSFGFVQSYNSVVELYLPLSAYDELDISTSSGVIYCDFPYSGNSGISAKEIKANSTSGGVYFSGLCGSEVTRLSTTSGGITLVGADSDEIKLNTTSGGVSLKDTVADEIRLSSVSGGVSASVIDCGSFAVNSTSGGISLEDISASDVEIGSVSGGVKASNLSAGSSGDMSVSTTSGTMRLSGLSFKELTINTVSGTAQLSGLNIDGFELKTSTVSGGVNINSSLQGKGSAKINFSSVSGSLTIN